MYGAVALFFGECCIVEMIFAIGSDSEWSLNVVCKGWVEVTAGD